MCGRFEIDPDIPELKTLVSGSGLSLQYKTGEIFPADTALVLTNKENDIIPASMIWGFPKWDGKGVIFNARINGEDIRSFLDRTPHSLTVGKTI